MVNVFEYERMGVPFNNTDSAHEVEGGDYEHKIIEDAVNCPCKGTGIIPAPDGFGVCRKHWKQAPEDCPKEKDE